MISHKSYSETEVISLILTVFFQLCTSTVMLVRLRNHLYCVEWGVKLYSLPLVTKS